MLILPGLALVYSINSGTVLAGTDGFTSMTKGVRMMPATGAMSRPNFKIKLFVERRVNCGCGASYKQRIAIGRCIHDRFGADIGAGAWLILDHDWLAEPL